MKREKAIYLVMFLAGMQVSLNTVSAQQKEEPLPLQLFNTMRDSTNSVDVVMLSGSGGSLSIDGKNVRFFNTFFENKSAKKTGSPLSGIIMWLINGREIISGNYFLGDSTGYVVYQKDGKEFVNQINQQGNSLLKSKIK